MGVSISQVYSHRRPLLGLSEQISVIPAEGKIAVNNPAFKVLYFFTGDLELSLDDGSRYAIQPGDVVVLPHACNQYYRSTGTGEIAHNLHALVLSFDIGPAAVGSRPGKLPEDELTLWLRHTFRTNRHWSGLSGANSIHESHSLWRLAIAIRRACESRNRWTYPLICELARLMVLCVAAATGLEKPPCHSPERARLEALCQEMFSRNALPETLQGTGDEQLFERYFDFNFLQFLYRLRVDRAKSLLLNSSFPVGQIAAHLGFTSPGTFSRVFKSFAGLSPNQYRQGHSANRLFSIRHESPKTRTPPPEDHPGPWQWREIHSRTTTLAPGVPCLLLPLEGNVTVELPGETCLLHAGESSLLLTSKPARVRGKKFRIALLPLTRFHGRVPLSKAMRPAGWKSIAHGPAELIGPLRERLLHPPQTRYERVLFHSLTSALVYESLAFCEETFPSTPPPGERPRYELLTESAKEYISKHLSRPLTLGEIAYAVGVSEEHLARVFRATAGTSVMPFLFQQRALQARKLLIRSRHSISEIAYHCGFQTVAHFYRTFRSMFDTTPGSFRSGEK